MKINHLLIFLILMPTFVRSQEIGIKTNFLYWTTTTPNLSVEIPVAPKTTMSVTGSYNPFQFGNKTANKK